MSVLLTFLLALLLIVLVFGGQALRRLTWVWVELRRGRSEAARVSRLGRLLHGTAPVWVDSTDLGLEPSQVSAVAEQQGWRTVLGYPHRRGVTLVLSRFPVTSVREVLSQRRTRRSVALRLLIGLLAAAAMVAVGILATRYEDDFLLWFFAGFDGLLLVGTLLAIVPFSGGRGRRLLNAARRFVPDETVLIPINSFGLDEQQIVQLGRELGFVCTGAQRDRYLSTNLVLIPARPG